ncbi:MAG TPA: ATP synthase F0 subunit C [Vicinamibacterales bacterium]|nr:ATP synthase F0 subunit C [Vicinamibacterales bacterium]
MSKRTFWTTALMVMAGVAFPLYAQEPGAGAARLEIIKWSIIGAGFPLGIAAAFGALGQGKAIAAAAEAIARNPSATGDIRGALILGLVLIESLVIYVLLISLILFFLPPFGSGKWGV